MKRQWLMLMLSIFLASTICAEDAASMVEKKIETYATNSAIEFNQDIDGRFFYKAISVSIKKAQSKQWAKGRQMAYEKAYMEARQEFIKDIFGRQSTSTYRKFFQNESEDNRDFEESRTTSKLVALWDKIIALKDEQMNQKLLDAGLNPEDYDALPVQQKRILFMDTFIKKSLTRARGDISGMLPLKTFCAVDPEGTTAVGVIAMYSPKLKQLAYEIRNKREIQIRKKEGKKLDQWIPETDKELSNEFGIRCVYDENGIPNLISYGQWSYIYSGSSASMRYEKKKSAFNVADDLANANISEFLRSSMSYRSENKQGTKIEHAVIYEDGFITEEEVEDIIDQTFSRADIRSRSEIRARIFKKWEYKQEKGPKTLGIVKIWTPEIDHSRQKVRNWRPDRNKKLEKKPTVIQKQKEEITESRDVMEIDDF